MSWRSRPATHIAAMVVLGTLAVVLVGPQAAAADDRTPPAPPKASQGAQSGIGPVQVGPVQVGPVQVGPVQVGPVGPVQVGPVEVGPIDVGGTVGTVVGGVTGTGHHKSGTDPSTGSASPDPVGPQPSSPAPSSAGHGPDRPNASTAPVHRPVSKPEGGTGTQQHHAGARSTRVAAHTGTGTRHRARTKQIHTVDAAGAGAGSGTQVLGDPSGTEGVLHRVGKLATDALGAPFRAGRTILIVLGVATVLAIGVLVLLVSTGRRPQRV